MPTVRQQKISEEKRRLERETTLFSVVGLALGVVSVVLALISFFPRITISQLGSSREHEAMGAIFDVTNGGLLPIENVEVRCGLDDLSIPNGPSFFNGPSITSLKSRVEELPIGQSVSTECDSLIRGDFEQHGTMPIIVVYRPLFWFRRRGIRFIMESARTDTGTWNWKKRKTESYPVE